MAHGFARTSPSYETSYTLDDQMGKNGWGNGFTFPCLFKTPAGWLLLSEAGTDGGYVGCRLLNAGGSNYKIGFPQEGEMNGFGTTSAAVSLPCETPWRTITLGTTLAPIVETTVTNDVVRPKYQASKEYVYGKGSWSWIIGMDPSCNFDEQKRYIDFSAAMGWRSVLVDALWDVQIGYEKMAELARYGRERGVGLFLWYNSNGSWNDAPQSPKGKMDKSAARRKEMAWMKENGILGIKVDFFGGDKQPMMQLYEDILTDANEFGLQVIFQVGSACILTTSLPRLSWLLRTSTSDRAPAMLRLSTPASTPLSATPWALWTLAVLRSTSTTTRTTSTAPRARPATFSHWPLPSSSSPAYSTSPWLPTTSRMLPPGLSTS